MWATTEFLAEIKDVYDGSSNDSEYPRYDHRYAHRLSLSQDAQALSLAYGSRQRLGGRRQGVGRATGAINLQDNIAGQDVLPRYCRRSGGNRANDELSFGVGAEYESYRIELICPRSAGTFKVTSLIGVIDLNSELAEDIASQCTNDSGRSFIRGGTVCLVWP
jgi:hypothetical protein